jgi:predicted nuclease of predicted toxin-antitoxin system
MDVHVNQSVTSTLRRAGVDVLTAQEDGCAELNDAALLDRATSLTRVLFTQDRDLLCEASRRQRAGESFAGVVYAHQVKVTIGQCIHDLELIAEACEPTEWSDRLEYLPL